MANRSGERVEIFKGANRDWRFRRVSANEETVAQSEGYMNRVDAVHTSRKIFSQENVSWWVQNEDDSWTELHF